MFETEGERDLSVNEEDISPIPLTKRILEKNGFRFDEQKEHFKLIVRRSLLIFQEIRVELPEKDFEGSIYAFGPNGEFESNELCRISVDALQRALRLCGMEDLAEGFKV